MPTVHGPTGHGPGLAGIWPEITQAGTGSSNCGFDNANVHGQTGLGPGTARIWLGISQMVTGIGNRGFDNAGGVNGRGPAV